MTNKNTLHQNHKSSEIHPQPVSPSEPSALRTESQPETPDQQNFPKESPAALFEQITAQSQENQFQRPTYEQDNPNIIPDSTAVSSQAFKPFPPNPNSVTNLEDIFNSQIANSDDEGGSAHQATETINYLQKAA